MLLQTPKLLHFESRRPGGAVPPPLDLAADRLPIGAPFRVAPTLWTLVVRRARSRPIRFLVPVVCTLVVLRCRLSAKRRAPVTLASYVNNKLTVKDNADPPTTHAFRNKGDFMSLKRNMHTEKHKARIPEPPT